MYINDSACGRVRCVSSAVRTLVSRVSYLIDETNFRLVMRSRQLHS